MNRSFAFLIALLLGASVARAEYYSVTGGGVQFQIGDGERPMPIQPPTTGGTKMKQVGTGTMFPPLLIPVNPDPAKALVQQTAGPDPKKITIPPGIFFRAAPGPKAIGVKRANPKLFQVRTNIAFSAPAPAIGAAVLKAGGRTGPPLATFIGAVPTSRAFYEKTAAQFGGPLQTRLVPATQVREWVNIASPKLPCKHPALGGVDSNCYAVLLPQYPGTLAPFGAPVGFTAKTAGTPLIPMNIRAVSIPNTTGLIAQSAPNGNLSLVDKATSAGFPWTTGRVIVSSKDALGRGEKFSITGKDSRVNGEGTISLVSAAFGNRRISGTNGNRGWLRIIVPEPGAAAGAAAALATLAVCHLLVRGCASERAD